MRRLIILAAAVLSLAACGDGPNGGRIVGYEVTMPDGRVVECVAADAGGVDCDWQGAS